MKNKEMTELTAKAVEMFMVVAIDDIKDKFKPQTLVSRDEITEHIEEFTEEWLAYYRTLGDK